MTASAPALPHSRAAAASSRTVAARLMAVAAALALALALLAGAPPRAEAYPPGLLPKAQVQAQLNGLRVAAEGSMAGYSRDQFPHWTSSGGCTTRQRVLQRDGTNIVMGANCQPTSGTWFSEYDGVTRTSPSQIDIDHVVPLAEAWRSGASSWTTDRRRAFANDLTGPQLIAVTSEINSAKGDRDPASWTPPLISKHCAYSKFWIQTKHTWGLSLQQAEKSALQTMLNRCSY